MGREIQAIRDELARLMAHQIENLRRQTFGGATEGDLKKEDELLHRIRGDREEKLNSCS
jgi:hypothetical protein